jgi:hypothetical protein
MATCLYFTVFAFSFDMAHKSITDHLLNLIPVADSNRGVDIKMVNTLNTIYSVFEYGFLNLKLEFIY